MKITSNCIEITRMKRGLSLRELGRQAGITAASLSAIERGISKPRPQTAKRLCDALEMEFDELFTVAEREEVQS